MKRKRDGEKGFYMQTHHDYGRIYSVIIFIVAIYLRLDAHGSLLSSQALYSGIFQVLSHYNRQLKCFLI